MKTLIRALPQAFVFFLLLSCQEGGHGPGDSTSDESDAKSLDNFAAGSQLTQNQCGTEKAHGVDRAAYLGALPLAAKLTVAGTIPSAEKGPLRQAALTALSALPNSIQVQFTQLPTAKIIVTNKHAELCKKPEKASESSGCYIAEEDEGKLISLVLVLANDVKEIRHGALRHFGYLYADIFSRYVFDEQKEFRKIEQSKTWKERKSNISKIFLNEAKEVKQDLTNPLFSDFVFAEALDSYFCKDWGDKNTREKFKTGFPATFAKFEATIKEVLAYSETVAAQKSGYSLQSPWSGGGYSYYPSYGGLSSGQSYGGYSNGTSDTYTGSYVGSGGYYNTYQTPGGGTSYSYHGLPSSSFASTGFSAAPAASASSAGGGGLDAANMMGD
jgi:hypothetical protein